MRSSSHTVKSEIAILFLLAFAVNIGESAEPPAASRSGIQGVWYIRSAKGVGIATSKLLRIDATKTALIIRPDNGAATEAKYTLDPRHTPAAIELKFESKTTPGIYELNGDTLRLCLGNSDKRPKAFAASDDAMLLVLERGQAEPDDPHSYGVSADNAGSISAPVTYEDTMLVAVTSEGVAAIVFGEPVERGRKYHFRFLKKGETKEITGSGLVFERYVNGSYAGGQLSIRAGAIRLWWSAGGEARGWIYYKPETTRLQIASAKRFEDLNEIRLGQTLRYEKLDLKRFLRQP